MTEKEIIGKIRIIETEQQRRKNLAINKYNTGEKIHLKQLAFHKCLKRNRWVFGGNRSGKTECGAVEAIYMARGVHGQAIYIDPAAQMVIARFASTYYASNKYIDPLSIPAYEAVAEYLLNK